MKYIVITSDTFDIAKRLKQIDKRYLLKWNLSKKRYEVFFKTSKKEQQELVLPYTELDARTISYVNKTRVENNKLLFMELEKNNQKLEQENKQKVLDEASTKIKEISKYVFKKGEHTPFLENNSYKTKWV